MGSYYRNSRSRNHRRNNGKPEPERNIPAAFFSLVVGGIFAVAMAEPIWLSINGGKCDGHHIGLYKMFGVGHHTEKELEGIWTAELYTKAVYTFHESMKAKIDKRKMFLFTSYLFRYFNIQINR